MPYNNRFNPTQRGRHALCSTGSKEVGRTAKVAPEPPLARPFQAEQEGATASRVNRALYGRNKEPALLVKYDMDSKKT